MNDEHENEITENDEPDPANEDLEWSRLPVVELLGVTVGLLLLVFGVTYIPDVIAALNDGEPQQHSARVSAPELPTEEEESQPHTLEPFSDIPLEAESAMVWDVANQRVLFEKAPDEKHPLASLTKLMTAVVAHELLGADSEVTISLDAVLQDGDSGFIDGEEFTSEDLRDLMLITSSNDGAYALAEAAGGVAVDSDRDIGAFLTAMNITAEEMGLTQTQFANPTGLDLSEDEAGAYGSARDVTFLMEHIITTYPEIVELTTAERAYIANEEGARHLAANTNHSVHDIPGIIASKTGYTELAGGNLVVAFDVGLNHPIIVSVLGSTYNGRFADVATLIQETRNAFTDVK